MAVSVGAATAQLAVGNVGEFLEYTYSKIGGYYVVFTTALNNPIGFYWDDTLVGSLDEGDTGSQITAGGFIYTVGPLVESVTQPTQRFYHSIKRVAV